MSNNKKINGIIIGLIILLIVMISVKSGKVNVASIINPSHSAGDSADSGDGTNGSSSGSGNSAVDGTNSETKGDSQSSGDSQNGDDSNSSGGENSSSSDNNSNSGSNSGSNSSGSSNNSSYSKDGSITNFNNTSQKVSSNFKPSDADITIQRINGYSGIYIEDGSDKEVSNVAAIQVKNNSKKAIEFAQIQLYNGDKKLVFDVTSLPANASAVVMEKNKATFNSSSGVTYGGTTASYVSSLEKASTVKCEKVSNNGIKVTNKSKKDIPCVRIFYKYKSSEGYYVGGITYTAKIENLKAGESQTVYPSHFDSDGGEIMMVKTYTTTD